MRVGVGLLSTGCVVGRAQALDATVVTASAEARVVMTHQGQTVEARVRAACAQGHAVAESDVIALLAPHGQWRTVESLGSVWVPEVQQRENFAPYVTHGQWQPEPTGVTWASTLPGGFMTFAYGRWVSLGGEWAWVPMSLAPAGVQWRHSGAWVGWSAGGTGWIFAPTAWLFAPDLSRRVAPAEERPALLAASVALDDPWRVGSPGGAGDLGARRSPRGPAPYPGETRSDEGQEREPAREGARPLATVVIRDDQALAQWQSWVDEAPHAQPPVSSSLVAAPAPSAYNLARAPSAPNAAPTSASSMWGDQERARAPQVARMGAYWQPQGALANTAMPTTSANLSRNAGPQQGFALPATVTPSGRGGIQYGTGVGVTGPVVVRPPAAQTVAPSAPAVRVLAPSSVSASPEALRSVR